jgi:hypothetical protein
MPHHFIALNLMATGITFGHHNPIVTKYFLNDNKKVLGKNQILKIKNQEILLFGSMVQSMIKPPLIGQLKIPK